MENTDKKEKTPEERLQERQGDNLLKFIIAKTYVRHSSQDEQEFLKEIGFENSGKTEEEAIRISKMNLFIETTAELIKATNTVKMLTATLKTYLIDEKITEEEV